MRKVLFFLICGLMWLNRVSLSAEIKPGSREPVLATVLTNEVNIRAGRGLNFEVLGQVDNLDTVTVLAEESGWYKIQLPKWSFCFVHGKFIENNVVQTDKLWIRAGKGTNFNILGLLKRGDKVEVLEKDGDWLRITPPEHCVGWIRKDYLKLVQKKFSLPADNVPSQKVLPEKTLEFSGIIEDLGKIINRPGTHKLTVDKESFYCLKSENINFNQYLYQQVQISGRLVELKNFPYPVLQVEQIKLK